MENKFIERHILIGLITSTEYLQEIRDTWNIHLLESPMAKRLASWCIEYFDKYNKAPQKDIEGIYFQKLKSGLPKDIAEEIEEDILPDLSEEYERDNFNLQYLLDQSKKYFNERHLEKHSEQIRAYVNSGELLEAERLANEYRPLQKEVGTAINLSDPASLERVDKAFSTALQPLIQYAGALGQFWNHQLTRDSFIAIMASEKRGKSYMLLDFAKRAVKQRLKVAFFQAGDMSESQQLRRIGINLLKKSDREEYCGKMYEPMKDCVYNQLDECSREVRECDHGAEFEGTPDVDWLRKEVTKNDLIKALKDSPDYKPCHNCREYQHNNWGAVWLREVNVGHALERGEVVRAFQRYFVDKKRGLMLSTHANNTLSVPQIKTTLDIWYKQGFVPDVIVIDYADLLTSETKEFRHQQNDIWKNLRSLSEERHCLVITATQADADSYGRNTLSMKNFSEDKRKYAHVTAMWGLNQDPKGREKEIGIMRINEIVVREGEPQRVVSVLQNLKRGQPVLTSYW